MWLVLYFPRRCHDIGDCRYYFWYPIDYSPAPLYCYLYRSCLGGADEERVGVVVAGRHPGTTMIITISKKT